MGDSWQPIETAPKDGTNILVYDAGDYGVCKVHWYISKDWESKEIYWQSWCISDVEGSDGPRYATHWMPLPKPPVDKPK